MDGTELLREWQRVRVVPLVASMDWVVDVAVLEVARVEAQPPVVPLELQRARDAVMDRLARAEVDPAAVRP